MKYTIDYFINKFEAIPEDEFCVGHFKSEDGRRCFLGHTMSTEMIYKVLSAGGDDTGCTNYQFTEYELKHKMAETKALCVLIADGRKDKGAGSHRAILINNGKHPDYQQPTPKQRVLAALRDLKSKQVKERIVYVTVDEKVRELQKCDALN